MAPVIDTSTPAGVATSGATSTTTLTTAAFTPPVGALLVFMFQQSWDTTTTSTPSNSGGAVTWDGAAAVSLVANGISQIWRGVVTSSASMTVTGTASHTIEGWGFQVAVITGQAASQAGAATKTATSASGAPSATITSLTGANSLVVGSVANDSSSTGPTIPAGQSDSFNANTFLYADATTSTAGWAQYLTGMNLAAGASATINDTAPTIAYSLAMLEILAAASAAATIPDLIMAPAHR